MKWFESSNEFSVYYEETRSKFKETASRFSGWGGDFKSINSFYFNKQKTFSGELDFTYEFPGIDRLSKNQARVYSEISFRYSLMKKRLLLSAGLRDIFKSKTLKWSQELSGITNSGSVNNGTRKLALTARYNFGNNKIKKGNAHSELGGDSGRVF